ncbi:HNH endonuclease [Rhodococcus aetherivorans]|uniref:HNH endonuclease n=1 Tax=Rhodococcus aetherivorans TaxID=191292 RepID=UPI0024201F35|nr:HNH endonuclease [Rhodococcus aetherivorans]WFS16035.1 HNH endonuclease [Rhodococcus aetherivorans]
MGRSTKYTREVLEDAVRNSASVAGVMRYLGLVPSGGSHHHLSRRIKRLGLDTSHFTGQAHMGGAPARNRLPWREVLVVQPTGTPRRMAKLLRRALLESGRPHKCESCGIGPEWCDLPLTLHVDHIDGNPNDSRPENVRFLCPNCHSQTATWAARNHRLRTR